MTAQARRMANAQILSVTRASWRDRKEMPKERVRLNWERTFSFVEYDKIMGGCISESLDDKWFACLDGDWLELYRPWTGYCIFWMRLEPVEQGYRVSEAWVNRDLKQYGHTDDLQDAKNLDSLVDHLLLGNPNLFVS
jgi:hypothetical protein